MAADRLSDFKLGMGVLIKADEDWRSVGRPQVAMHRNCTHFPVFSKLHRHKQCNVTNRFL